MTHLSKTRITINALVALTTILLTLVSCSPHEVAQAAAETEPGLNITHEAEQPKVAGDASKVEKKVDDVFESMAIAIHAIGLNNLVAILCFTDGNPDLDCYEDIRTKMNYEWNEADVVKAVMAYRGE